MHIVHIFLLDCFILDQWSQTQFLEGHSSAEFSSNQLQLTPAWKFLVILLLLNPFHTARWSRKIAGVPSVWTQTRPGINSRIDPGLGT